MVVAQANYVAYLTARHSYTTLAKMRFFSVVPFALFTLGLANKPEEAFAAVLYRDKGYKFGVKRGDCVNLKRNQPIFHEIRVGRHELCTVYENLRCEKKVEKFRAGAHEITHVVFKSIKCPVSEEL